MWPCGSIGRWALVWPSSLLLWVRGLERILGKKINLLPHRSLFSLNSKTKITPHGCVFSVIFFFMIYDLFFITY
jgi:hypothetical protein